MQRRGTSGVCTAKVAAPRKSSGTGAPTSPVRPQGAGISAREGEIVVHDLFPALVVSNDVWKGFLWTPEFPFIDVFVCIMMELFGSLDLRGHDKRRADTSCPPWFKTPAGRLNNFRSFRVSVLLSHPAADTVESRRNSPRTSKQRLRCRGPPSSTTWRARWATLKPRHPRHLDRIKGGRHGVQMFLIEFWYKRLKG